MTSVPVSPFGVVTSANGRWVFVSDAHGITVLRAAGPAASPKVVRSVPIPGAPELLGEALTPDGRYLLVAASNETVVLSVAGLESGSSRVLAGALPLTGGGAIAVAVSANGRFAFTSLENSASVEVSNLSRALSAGFNASGVSVGRVPTGRAPVGAAVSPNGRWLYVTSEAASPAVRGHAGSSRQHCAWLTPTPRRARCRPSTSPPPRGIRPRRRARQPWRAPARSGSCYRRAARWRG